MSFDFESTVYNVGKDLSQSLWNRAMSFDTINSNTLVMPKSLNPFGTGQCLSTLQTSLEDLGGFVSIPLEQGNVFRPYENV